MDGMTGDEDTRGDAPERAWAEVAAQFLPEPAVTEGTGFGRTRGLRVNDRIFVMLMSGELVLKLPRPRVDELIAAGTGRPFPGGGRVMREWVTIPAADSGDWHRLAAEAHRFVAAGGSEPRTRRGGG